MLCDQRQVPGPVPCHRRQRGLERREQRGHRAMNDLGPRFQSSATLISIPACVQFTFKVLSYVTCFF